MSCNGCSLKACSCIGVILSIIFGAAIGVLFAFRYIPAIVVSAWIAFGLGVLTLILLTIGVFFAGISMPNVLSKCLCLNGTCLLVGSIGTIIMALAALSISLTPAFISIIVLVALGAFFFALMLISLIATISCIICKACTHHVSC